MQTNTNSTLVLVSSTVYDTNRKGDIIKSTVRTYADDKALQSALDEKRADDTVMAFIGVDAQNLASVKSALNALEFDLYTTRIKDSYVLGSKAGVRAPRVEVDLGSLK